MNESLLSLLRGLADQHFGKISKPLRTNIAVLTVGFLTVLAGMRSGQGRLSLAALARALPLSGRPRSRENRLSRYLGHDRLDSRTLTTTLTSLLFSEQAGLCPILLDQTKSGNAQALVAAVPYAGRALPIALYTFEYPLTEPALISQNHLEHIFLLDVETALPPLLQVVWIADRGYARSLLLQQSEVENRMYIPTLTLVWVFLGSAFFNALKTFTFIFVYVLERKKCSELFCIT